MTSALGQSVRRMGRLELAEQFVVGHADRTVNVNRRPAVGLADEHGTRPYCALAASSTSGSMVWGARSLHTL
jgi:hypothetical protein